MYVCMYLIANRKIVHQEHEQNKYGIHEKCDGSQTLSVLD